MQNEVGALAKITRAIGLSNANIENLKLVSRSRDFYKLDIDIGVFHLSHLNLVISSIRKIAVVHRVVKLWNKQINESGSNISKIYRSGRPTGRPFRFKFRAALSKVYSMRESNDVSKNLPISLQRTRKKNIRDTFGPIDLIVSPAMGGVIVGYEVAKQLGVPAIFFERVEGQFQLRRGFEIKKIRQNVLWLKI